MIEVVCGDLFSWVNINLSSAFESEIFCGKTDSIGMTGVVDDRGDGKQALNINIFILILSNNVDIGVDDSNQSQNQIFRKPFQSEK